jgi:hypothetical protein
MSTLKIPQDSYLAKLIHRKKTIELDYQNLLRTISKIIKELLEYFIEHLFPSRDQILERQDYENADLELFLYNILICRYEMANIFWRNCRVSSLKHSSLFENLSHLNLRTKWLLL